MKKIALILAGFASFGCGLFGPFYIGHLLNVADDLRWWSIPTVLALIGLGVGCFFGGGRLIEIAEDL